MDIEQLIKEKSQVNLSIEGKYSPEKGFILMDSRGGDIEWHFNKLPWPLPKESVNIVRADRVIQKVPKDNFIPFMDEVWRVLKYDGQFMISVPYPGSHLFYQDPLNVNPCNETTFTYFDPLEPIAGVHVYKMYKPKPWKIAHMSYTVNGIMEVLLEKRREDESYGKD